MWILILILIHKIAKSKKIIEKVAIGSGDLYVATLFAN